MAILWVLEMGAPPTPCPPSLPSARGSSTGFCRDPQDPEGGLFRVL